jgi:hypothetical protein
MDTLTIRGESQAVIEFSSPRRNVSGWVETYDVRIGMPGMSAALVVENPGFGQPPTSFFADLAENWRGWKGSKEWRAIEGEYDLLATADSLGHVSLTAVLRPDSAMVPSCWKAQISLIVEAGHLGTLQHDVATFFAVGSAGA